MCESKKSCQKPEELKGKPSQCSPKQIKKCHGDAKGHPCKPNQPKAEEGR